MYSLPYAFGIIKGTSVQRGDALAILSQLTRRGFTLIRFLDTSIYADKADKLHLPAENHIEHYEVMTSTYRIIPFIVSYRSNVLDTRKRLMELVGTSLHASQCGPGTIRHMFGGFRYRSAQLDDVDNCIHLAPDEKSSWEEEGLFFDRAMWDA